jgi:hypothetical protein
MKVYEYIYKPWRNIREGPPVSATDGMYQYLTAIYVLEDRFASTTLITTTTTTSSTNTSLVIQRYKLGLETISHMIMG